MRIVRYASLIVAAIAVLPFALIFGGLSALLLFGLGEDGG